MFLTGIKILDNLEWFIHGHHTYYFSIKVENTAGLVNIQTSDPYIQETLKTIDRTKMEFSENVFNWNQNFR
jgi:hypothetical protein